MGIQVKQHIPSSISGLEPGVATVETAAELLAVPWVDSWTRDPGFYRFSVNHEYVPPLLMAERESGREWWVVAYLRDGDASGLGLPKWEKPPKPPPAAPRPGRTEN